MAGAAVTPAPPGAQAGSSHTLVGERHPSAASAKSCNRWGH